MALQGDRGGPGSKKHVKLILKNSLLNLVIQGVMHGEILIEKQMYQMYFTSS